MHSGKLKAFKNSASGVEAAQESGRFFAATFLRHGPSMRWCDSAGVRYDPMAALSGGVNTSDGYTGDGSSAHGGITGVLTKALQPAHSKAKVAATSGHDTLAEIDADDLLRLMAAIPQYAKGEAKWYCSPTVSALVFDAISIAGGGNSMQNLANAPEPTFLGYPIIVTPMMADTYNGAAMIGFGNLRQAATVATRRGVRVQTTDQRYWAEDQIGIKGTLRHSIVVHDLGSSTVKSPFAVLTGTT